MHRAAIVIGAVVALAGCSKANDDPFSGQASSTRSATEGKFVPSPPGKYEYRDPLPAGSATPSAAANNASTR